MNLFGDLISPEDLARTDNLELLSKQIMEGFRSGRHRSKLKGGCAEFAEHRAYTAGDEVRLLDWRVYGKSDRYYIKQFEEETSLQVILALDGSGSMEFGLGSAPKFAYARAACLVLARLVIQQGDSAGLAVLGGGLRSFVPPRGQPRHLDVLAEKAREAAPSGPTTLAADLGLLAQRLRRRAVIALFSDCFDDADEFAHSLRLLRSRRHEVLVFHVMAPEELSFSFQRMSRFESLEREGQMIDLDPVAIRPEYLARLQTFLRKLQRTCGESGCEYIPFSTGQPIGEALAAYLRRRAAAAK
jgi:uncharacterized protein (DUF58 family)